MKESKNICDDKNLPSSSSLPANRQKHQGQGHMETTSHVKLESLGLFMRDAEINTVYRICAVTFTV